MEKKDKKASLLVLIRACGRAAHLGETEHYPTILTNRYYCFEKENSKAPTYLVYPPSLSPMEYPVNVPALEKNLLFQFHFESHHSSFGLIHAAPLYLST